MESPTLPLVSLSCSHSSHGANIIYTSHLTAFIAVLIAVNKVWDELTSNFLNLKPI